MRRFYFYSAACLRWLVWSVLYLGTGWKQPCWCVLLLLLYELCSTGSLLLNGVLFDPCLPVRLIIRFSLGWSVFTVINLGLRSCHSSLPLTAWGLDHVEWTETAIEAYSNSWRRETQAQRGRLLGRYLCIAGHSAALCVVTGTMASQRTLITASAPSYLTSWVHISLFLAPFVFAVFLIWFAPVSSYIACDLELEQLSQVGSVRTGCNCGAVSVGSSFYSFFTNLINCDWNVNVVRSLTVSHHVEFSFAASLITFSLLIKVLAFDSLFNP